MLGLWEESRGRSPYAEYLAEREAAQAMPAFDVEALGIDPIAGDMFDANGLDSGLDAYGMSEDDWAMLEELADDNEKAQAAAGMKKGMNKGMLIGGLVLAAGAAWFFFGR